MGLTPLCALVLIGKVLSDQLKTEHNRRQRYLKKMQSFLMSNFLKEFESEPSWEMKKKLQTQGVYICCMHQPLEVLLLSSNGHKAKFSLTVCIAGKMICLRLLLSVKYCHLTSRAFWRIYYKCNWLNQFCSGRIPEANWYKKLIMQASTANAFTASQMLLLVQAVFKL